MLFGKRSRQLVLDSPACAPGRLHPRLRARPARRRPAHERDAARPRRDRHRLGPGPPGAVRLRQRHRRRRRARLRGDRRPRRPRQPGRIVQRGGGRCHHGARPRRSARSAPASGDLDFTITGADGCAQPIATATRTRTARSTWAPAGSRPRPTAAAARPASSPRASPSRIPAAATRSTPRSACSRSRTTTSRSPTRPPTRAGGSRSQSASMPALEPRRPDQPHRAEPQRRLQPGLDAGHEGAGTRDARGVRADRPGADHGHRAQLRRGRADRRDRRRDRRAPPDLVGARRQPHRTPPTST